jgi:NAD-dependent dihydropyrimidine dehydrogenase PreA subunit
MVRIVIDNGKCTGCSTCVDTCPVSVYEVKDGKSVPVKSEDCLVCRACEVQCPENAIQVVE